MLCLSVEIDFEVCAGFVEQPNTDVYISPLESLDNFYKLVEEFFERVVNPDNVIAGDFNSNFNIKQEARRTSTLASTFGFKPVFD